MPWRRSSSPQSAERSVLVSFRRVPSRGRAAVGSARARKHAAVAAARRLSAAEAKRGVLADEARFAYQHIDERARREPALEAVHANGSEQAAASCESDDPPCGA